MLKNEIVRRFFSYIFLSGLAFLVNLASRFGYQYLLEAALDPDYTIGGHLVAFNVAVALAYFTGMIVNFATSKWITFKSADTGRGKREAIKFVIIAAIGLVINVVVAAYALILLQNMIPETMQADFIAMIQSMNPASRMAPAEMYSSLIETTAHLIGIGIGLVFNFAGHQMLSFQNTGLWDKITGNKAAGSK